MQKETPEFLRGSFAVIDSILEKAKKIDDLKIVSLPKFVRVLNYAEKDLLDKFLWIDPEEYGIRMEFFGHNVGRPKKLIPIIGQKRIFPDGKRKIVSDQFLPKTAYIAFGMMNKALHNATGRRLVILSGYRAPAYQSYIFLFNLKKYDFDFFKVVKIAALPGYSEHCGWPDCQAIDVIGSSPAGRDLSVFDKSEEFRWLSENAYKFGFNLSYPRCNGAGIVYEPWHWCWHSRQLPNRGEINF